MSNDQPEDFATGCVFTLLLALPFWALAISLLVFYSMR